MKYIFVMIRHVVRNKNRGSIRYKTSFANAYDPVSVESGRYEKWEKLDASPYETKSTYSMILPPPNVTGRLHVGHALTLAIQDCFVRFQKMKGKNVTWIPGLDHAGIATQSVVEKQLKKTLNLTRQDMRREEFLEHVWDWTNSNGGHIEKQIKSLGASLDWTRQFFTLDEARSEAVTEAFVRLYDAGLIYRGERMVHWCPHLRTVISDIEIEYEDLTEGPQTLRLPNHQDVEFGYIHHFEYEIQNSSKKIEVATTRLETMLGDVAIAVHPEDPRWCSEIGHFATHPFRPGHRMPIVADETLVDMSTGTGAVKLTPAHDPNDFEAAKRHDLPVRSILDLNARMTEEVGSRYAGHDRFEVRDMLERDLNSLGLYRGKKKHEMRVARCSRSGDVLEPMLLPQWFVRTEDMAKESIRHVMTTGETKMIPKTLEKEWRRWLEHPQDWCVSRQLVWGHRIPAYRVVGHEDTFVVGRNLEEATTRAREKLDLSEDMDLRLEQDDDVLDTWFSSGLLPLSANGWPHRLDNDSYPLDLMETGSDILFFWVARMSMLCTYLDDQNRAPFRNVYCHSLVRDKYGRKMSKSLGNVILPEYVIDGRELKDLLQDLKDGNLSDKELKRSLRETKKEFPNGIEACGTDALRLALLLQGERPHLDASEVLQCRHFCNKLWQASRFTTLLRDRAGNRDELRHKEDHQDLPLLQRWIRSRLAFVSNEVNESLENYDAARAAHAVRSFVQNEYCGVFIEFAKPTQYEETCELAGTCLSASEVASEVLDSALKLLHPFVPYAFIFFSCV